MAGTDLRKPTCSRNMRLIGHSDQAGRSDGQQIMVRNGYAYVGHVCSKGFSVVDVRAPTRPKTVEGTGPDSRQGGRLVKRKLLRAQ